MDNKNQDKLQLVEIMKNLFCKHLKNKIILKKIQQMSR